EAGLSRARAASLVRAPLRDVDVSLQAPLGRRIGLQQRPRLGSDLGTLRRGSSQRYVPPRSATGELMYHQIARNRRNSIIVIAGFLVRRLAARPAHRHLASGDAR